MKNNCNALSNPEKQITKTTVMNNETTAMKNS
jgi:hypothetical protein